MPGQRWGSGVPVSLGAALAAGTLPHNWPRVGSRGWVATFLIVLWRGPASVGLPDGLSPGRSPLRAGSFVLHVRRHVVVPRRRWRRHAPALGLRLVSLAAPPGRLWRSLRVPVRRPLLGPGSFAASAFAGRTAPRFHYHLLRRRPQELPLSKCGIWLSERRPRHAPPSSTVVLVLSRRGAVTEASLNRIVRLLVQRRWRRLL